MLKSSCLSNNGQTSNGICIWCVGPSLCFTLRYYGSRKLQRRAARWVLNDYGWFSSAFSMLSIIMGIGQRSNLSASYLDYIHCIKYSIINYLCQFLRTIYLQYDLQDNNYHPLHYILPCSSMTAHQNSYFSRTIYKWLEQVNNTSYWNYRFWHF